MCPCCCKRHYFFGRPNHIMWAIVNLCLHLFHSKFVCSYIDIWFSHILFRMGYSLGIGAWSSRSWFYLALYPEEKVVDHILFKIYLGFYIMVLLYARHVILAWFRAGSMIPWYSMWLTGVKPQCQSVSSTSGRDGGCFHAKVVKKVTFIFLGGRVKHFFPVVTTVPD